MQLNIRYSALDHVKKDVLELLNDARVIAKITINKKVVVYDMKDPTKIKQLKNVKIVISIQGGKVLELKGSLECSFDPGKFGGKLFITNAIIIDNVDFKRIQGVPVNIRFTDEFFFDIPLMQQTLAEISSHKDFVFNVSQFDDFMEVFGYYKTLSEGLNNSVSYDIAKWGKKYFYLPISSGVKIDKDDLSFATEVFDNDQVLIGYEIKEHDIDMMGRAIREELIELQDIEIAKKENAFSKICRMKDSLYVSNNFVVDERNSDKLKQINPYNVVEKKDRVIISIEYKNDEWYKNLNIYDMGQKIKVESIDNSLKLISQGASGAAIDLIQYLIGDVPMPSTTNGCPINTNKYISGLNDTQKVAFLKSIDGSPITLIKGPPGTGKTHVINAIVQYITKELGEKAVVSSQTHIAIDNVLDDLMKNYDPVIPNRISNRKNKYSIEEIDTTLYNMWASKIDDHISRISSKKVASKISKDLENFKGEHIIKYSELTQLGDYSVIGATTTTSAIGGKKGSELLKNYKWLIIDEVSKCPITEVFRYLPYVEKIILVGDDYQLAPLLEFSKDDVKHLKEFDQEKFDKLVTTYEQSIFANTLEKARKANRLIELNENYRSLKEVFDTYNIFYNGKLIPKREDTNPRKVFLNDEDKIFTKDGKAHDVSFIEVKGGKEARDERTKSRFNMVENAAIQLVLEQLLKTVVNPSKVSVAAIFPYSAQIKRFTANNKDLINKARKVFGRFELDTVDAFQGKQSDIVLLSTVVTDPSLGNFLNDFRRINVSMSRAKDKLVIFGNSITLSKIEMNDTKGGKTKYFKQIIENIKINNNGNFVTYQTNEEGGAIKNDTKAKSGIVFETSWD